MIQNKAQEALDLFNNPDELDVEYWSLRADEMRTILAALEMYRIVHSGELDKKIDIDIPCTLHRNIGWNAALQKLKEIE